MTEHSTKAFTFLFTDIEGSTKLWEQYGDKMRAALDRHDALLREVFAGSGGRVFKALGDGFAVVFNMPEYAIAAAAQGQLSL